MNHKHMLVALCFLITSLKAKPTICEPIEKAARNECTEFYWENVLRVAPSFSYFEVKSAEDPALFLPEEKFSGFAGGVVASYEVFSADGLYALVESDVVAGRLKNKPDSNTMRVFGSNSKACFGFSYTPLQGNRLQATPYFGLGFTFFSEKLHDNFFVDRHHYFTVFLPVGFIISYTPISGIYLGIELEWFPDLDTTCALAKDAEERYLLPGETEQLSFSLPAQFLLADYAALEVIPFWKRVKTGRSVLNSSSFFIPHKRRTQWGVNLGASLLF